MRIGRVVGTVTLNRSHPSFVGARLRLVIPLSLADLTKSQPPQAESIVVWDELGAGLGDLIAISEGPEAAQPFKPAVKAIDAYAAAILDRVSIPTTE
ncbi:MAG TPA: EutN/CcmL family microcompartment protein [Pirellulaceae bacterium]|nr:EutN/CcmL family microcompartment protein [Pirellulaceae bacterium]